MSEQEQRGSESQPTHDRIERKLALVRGERLLHGPRKGFIDSSRRCNGRAGCDSRAARGAADAVPADRCERKQGWRNRASAVQAIRDDHRPSAGLLWPRAQRVAAVAGAQRAHAVVATHLKGAGAHSGADGRASAETGMSRRLRGRHRPRLGFPRASEAHRPAPNEHFAAPARAGSFVSWQSTRAWPVPSGRGPGRSLARRTFPAPRRRSSTRVVRTPKRRDTSWSSSVYLLAGLEWAHLGGKDRVCADRPVTVFTPPPAIMMRDNPVEVRAAGPAQLLSLTQPTCTRVHPMAAAHYRTAA